MDDSTNNRYGTRSAANPTQLAEASTTIKQEPIDEDVPDSRPKEPSAATMQQEASSSNCSSRDPLADEIEFGETGISFQNAFFNVVGNEIKTENIIAEEIEDNGDIVGSSTKRRKICEEDSGDDSSATRSTQQSACTMNPPSNSSDVWHHFERMENAGKCLYCSQVIRHSKSSTFSLKRHLASKHMEISQGRTQENISSLRDLKSYLKQQSPTTVASRFGAKEHLKSYSVETKETLDDNLLKFISKECLPFSTVDSDAFKQFCSGLNPNYVIPSRNIVAEAILKEKYVKSVQRVKDTLANTIHVALTLDEWPNTDSTTFYALTAHYIDGNYTFCSSLLECSEFDVPCTDMNIAQWIRRVIDDFNLTISNVAGIVTDNRPHTMSAVRNLNLKHLPCFAHTLNSIVIKCITHTIGDVIEKIKQIIACFKANNTATSKLAKVQTQLNLPRLKLKQDIPSRFTSTYVMIERFHQNKAPLLACLESMQMQHTLQSKDWTVMEQTINVLYNFDCAAKIASSEKHVMPSLAGLMIQILIQKTSDLLNGDLEDSVHNMARSLITDLSAISDPIVNQCMLLDPRMKRHSFENKDEMYAQTYDTIVELLAPFMATFDTVPDVKTEIATDPYRQYLFSDFINKVNVVERETSNPELKAKRELDEYISANYIAMTADPLLWWKQNESRFPSLYKLVQHMFCIPASSVPCERVFTKAGQMYDDKRARLDPKHVPVMLFLQQNEF
ncbi:zinc finger BED domain-containing protein 4-like isoform X2 [Anopheles funestus]|uniref:zinc finger BED domain-containing protein 4-like isoform X2 n=1 Tax=Anopheles funestus TaxID=62324 RepID=UPI0020C677EE|nr:zinc finger BED domain-containing protein 4-like isoform X2 [Anopheles funestus]